MKKQLLFIAICFTAITQLKSQNIAAARAAAIGSTVTVTGIVTSGSELGIIRYLQDNSAGISAYGSTLSAVQRGDSVSITGPTKLFSNLLEIDPITSYTIHATGKSVPSPLVIIPSAFDESKEGQLIRFTSCTFTATGNFASNTNYTVTSNSQTFVMRVTSTATTVIGTPIPTGQVSITGLASQFCSSPTSGCTTGYQLMVRDINDISSAPAGIAENYYNNSLKIYPNPTDNVVNFSVPSSETVKSVVVTDVSGRVVFSCKENAKSVNLSHLSNGIYNMIVSTDKQNYQNKVSVTK